MRRRNLYRRQHEIQITRNEPTEEKQDHSSTNLKEGREKNAGIEVREVKRGPCPNCGRQGMNFYFHTRKCKGDSPRPGMAARPD